MSRLDKMRRHEARVTPLRESRLPTRVEFALTAEETMDEYRAQARYEAERAALRPGISYRTETWTDPSRGVMVRIVSAQSRWS